jgi:hypothetical protein
VGGFITLKDGRSFALNNWAKNIIVQTIAVELPAAERGDPPMDLNPHMRSVLPPPRGRRWPGWDHQP